MPKDSTSDKANHVAEHLKTGTSGALQELHHDLQSMNSGQRKEFFHKLEKAAGGHQLPGLDIHEDSKHHLKVTEKGNGHVLYNEGAEHNGKPKPPEHHGRPQAPGSPESAQPKPGNGDQAAPPDAEKFSSGLRKGEGPYQGLQRQHPDWDHKHLMDESRKIKEQMGSHTFKQGEQFKTNDDGSVTARSTTSANDGSYTDTTNKNGKTSEVKTGDDKGNFNSTTFDENGNKTRLTEHVAGKDGAYTETQRTADGTTKIAGDKDGKNVETFDNAGKQQSSMRENNDGTTVGWRQNADGGKTNIDQKDPNHRTETTTDATGKVVSTKEHEQTADGSKDVTTDQKNNKTTDVFGKDGTQTSSQTENSDGSSKGWHTNPDGTKTTFEQKDKNHRTETVTNGDKTVSTTVSESNERGGTDVTTDERGKSVTTYDANHKQVASERTNVDGTSNSWSRDKHGSTTFKSGDGTGHTSSTTFDAAGHITNSETHEKNGDYEKKQYSGGYIYTTTPTIGRGGVHEEKTTKVKGDAPNQA